MAPKQKPGLSKQDYSTPPEFVSAVKGLLIIDNFSVDLAASMTNFVCPVFYDEQADALADKNPWTVDGWGWLNPPFAHIEPWVRKAYYESQNGAKIAMLVPASVGANWWLKWVHMKATVIFLIGRLTFVGHKDPYPKDCALLLYDEKDSHGIAPFYTVWSWRKKDV